MGVIIVNQGSIYYIYRDGVYLVHLLERVPLSSQLMYTGHWFLVFRSGVLCLFLLLRRCHEGVAIRTKVRIQTRFALLTTTLLKGHCDEHPGSCERFSCSQFNLFNSLNPGAAVAAIYADIM